VDQVSKEAYYTILGVKSDRSREVLAIVNFPTESATGWEEVFSGIKARGVEQVDWVVCDGLTGIENTIGTLMIYNSISYKFGNGKRKGKIRPIYLNWNDKDDFFRPIY
jgi:Transposase and inactivated derivatives